MSNVSNVGATGQQADTGSTPNLDKVFDAINANTSKAGSALNSDLSNLDSSPESSLKVEKSLDDYKVLLTAEANITNALADLAKQIASRFSS